MQLTPCDIDAEQALLGAIFVNNDALEAVAGIVRPEHFSEPIHARIFELAASFVADGRPVNPVTLNRHFPPDLDVAGMTPIEYLARLATAATTIVNAPDYAETVRDLWALRAARDVGQQLLDEAAAATTDPRGVLATALSTIDVVRAEIDGRRNISRAAGESVDDAVTRALAIRSGELDLASAPTGLSDLDRDIGGMKGGTLVVAAGRPGMGKSVLGSSVARQCALAGHGVLFFSLEMHEEQIAARLLADELFSSTTPLTFKAIIDAKGLSDTEIERMLAGTDRIKRLPLALDLSSSLTVSEIAARTRAKATQMSKRGTPLKAIIVDYLKFVKASNRYQGQRVYEVGEITAGLKALAKDLDICVVLLAQLNRQVETRQDKRPELSDLRESGDIEADADVVLLLFREAYYLAGQAERDGEAAAKLMACENTLEIIIAKNRNGPTRSVPVFCDVSANAVRNLSRY